MKTKRRHRALWHLQNPQQELHNAWSFFNWAAKVEVLDSDIRASIGHFRFPSILCILMHGQNKVHFQESWHKATFLGPWIWQTKILTFQKSKIFKQWNAKSARMRADHWLVGSVQTIVEKRATRPKLLFPKNFPCPCQKQDFQSSTTACQTKIYGQQVKTQNAGSDIKREQKVEKLEKKMGNITIVRRFRGIVVLFRDADQTQNWMRFSGEPFRDNWQWRCERGLLSTAINKCKSAPKFQGALREIFTHFEIRIARAKTGKRSFTTFCPTTSALHFPSFLMQQNGNCTTECEATLKLIVLRNCVPFGTTSKQIIVSKMIQCLRFEILSIQKKTLICCPK